MKLTARNTSSAHILPTQYGWRLSIPAGAGNAYRLAQLDDYLRLPRRRFPWHAPIGLSLNARLSAPDLPGTWGFGLWNDPFGFSIGFGGNPFRLLCLPNAAWFFGASAHNYLSFQDNQPARGFLAQAFCSPRIPSPLLAPGLLGTPLLAMRSLSRLARRLAGRIIREQSAALDVNVTRWHHFGLEWSPERIAFTLDGSTVLETPFAPRGPLGIIIWIDNQYAAWRPDGGLGFGVLENPDAWLEIKDVRCF